MENNNYNVSTRSEQEDANAAAGEPLSVKAAAYSMPGVTIDGGDPVAVYEAVGAAVDRARAGDGPTLVESKVYRLSAHGNIIAPPGVPLHYPSTRRSRRSATARSTRPRCAGTPSPGSARGWWSRACSTPPAPTRSRKRYRRNGRGGPVRARQPVPRARSSRQYEYVYA